MMKKLFSVFSGPTKDNGFYQSGWDGARAACDASGVDFQWVEGIGVDASDLAAAAREQARRNPDMVLVHGGSSDIAVREVASEFPNVQFLSTHGSDAGPNFSCFNIRQPQSAFLAGALAALTTSSGVVGHLSGIRILPGLNARAAWAQGAHYVDRGLRIVTCFCGTQDDNAVAGRATQQVIDAGADVIYTMLNSGRLGAIETCRARGVPQIGNVVDWCVLHPDVFIGSAIANNGEGVRQWVLDVVSGRLQHGVVRWLGMEQPDAVRLSVADRIPADVRGRLQDIGRQLVDGGITLQTEYAGPELEYQAA